MSDSTDAVFKALLAERGGASVFSTVQLALARKAAVALAEPDTTVAGLTQLLDMLPPLVMKRALTEPEVTLDNLEQQTWDLSRLDDLQLRQLEELHALATGAACPIRSRRLEGACDLARTLDAAEHTGRLDEAARTAALNAFHAILSPRMPYAFFGLNDADARITAAERALAAVQEERDQFAAKLRASQPSNVVQMPERGTAISSR